MTSVHSSAQKTHKAQQALEASPLLVPLSKPPNLIKLSPKKSNQSRLTLPLATRQQWLREAEEIGRMDDVQGRLEPTNSEKRGADVSFIDFPVVATNAELQASALGAQDGKQNSNISDKRLPLCVPDARSLPLYCRPFGSVAQHKNTKLKGRKRPFRLHTMASLSQEMRNTLESHLLDKIQGDIWQNEIRSRLARPLSATVFCERSERLDHPLSAPQYAQSSSGTPPLYPYSEEAHGFTRRIGRMYSKHCYRVAVLTHLRRLAVAIRFFRRVIVPWLIKAFRRRRRAAIKIQRCFRRHLHWKQTVLRSFVVRFVNRVIETGLRRVLAGLRIARRLHLQYQEKKRCEALARERRRVIYRWVAKTRVCLFVHTVWCVRFFRHRREENLQAIRVEISTLEQSDRDVRVEYSTIFTSAFGRSLLKKELKEWRERVKNQSVPPQDALDTSESVETGSAIGRLRRCFEIFDLDGSGALDLEECHLMLSYLRNMLNDKNSTKPVVHPKLTTAQVRDLFEVLDSDGNGKVTREELESWWTQQQQALSSLSASVSFLATGMNRLVLTGHGMLFWLLGKKQQLERKFVKKLLVKQAMESAKRVLLAQLIQDQSPDTRRCPQCARRFGLIRDWEEHQADCTANEWMVDTFVLHKWKREEELRLLEEDGGW